MVILQRTELGRNRLLYFLTIILSVSAITTAVSLSPQNDAARAALMILAVIGLVALGLCLLQLYAFPGRSHVLLVHRGDEMIIATNAMHEGFKLRFLRDVLSENIFTLTD